MSGWRTQRPITKAAITTHATASGKRRRSASGSITASSARRIPGFAGSLNAGSCRSNSKVAYSETSAAAASDRGKRRVRRRRVAPQRRRQSPDAHSHGSTVSENARRFLCRAADRALPKG